MMQSRDDRKPTLKGHRTLNAHPTNYRDLLREATLQIRSLRSELETTRQQQSEPIAIIGMACRFPGGANSPEAYWELLRNGVDAITDIPNQRWNVAAHYDPDTDAPGKMYTRSGGFINDVDQFDPQFFGISPREAHSLDPQQRLLLEVSYTALENAGQPPFDLRGSRTGVFIGVSFDDYAQISVRSGDLTRIDAHSSLGNTRSIAAGRLAYTFGFQGPTMQLDTTCSSSLLAVHLACQSLRSGESNLALAGGVNLMLSPEPTIGFCKLKALAPDGRCKTFDAAADGYGRGEGCGVVVLKRLSDAIDNQDPILALVRGSAVNHDGLSNGLTAPNGAAQEAVLRQALTNARVEPQQLQYVEVHGTGTRLGDPIEVLALNKVMGQRPTPLLIGSVKTNIGHLESAAGVAGLIKVILSLQHQQIPPHLNLQTPNPYIPWDQLSVAVPTQPTPWPGTEEPRLAGISSFGMSGTNVHLVVEEAPEEEFKIQNYEFKISDLGFKDTELVTNERPLHVLALSARSDAALGQLVQRYRDWLDSAVEEELADICFSASVGRSHFNHRLALLAADLPQLRQQLESYLNGHPNPTGISQRPTQTPRKIAFLFTGQGSQYFNMGRELYATEPVFRQAMDQCAEILAEEGIDLSEILYGIEVEGSEVLGTRFQVPGARSQEEPRTQYPIPDTHPPTHPSTHSLIHQTSLTQPALFALEYSLAQLWLAWGIEPDGVMGYSVGEYVAACVAGLFSLEDGLQLVAARGRLMQALPEGGGMVAVMASAERLSGMLPEGVAVAAVNGPEAAVISGELAALESVLSALAEQGIKTKPLKVSHAFHSELMEPMLAEFRAVAETVDYSPPQVELVANVTGQLASPAVASADYWVNHVRQPVQFAAGMQTLAAENYNTFIEIGSKPVLSAMGQACLPEIEALWLPSLRPEADWQTLLTSLGQLYASGATIDWAGFDRSHPRRMVRLPNYPFQRQRYWVELPHAPTLPLPHSPTLHPLLGSPLPLAGDTVRYFQAQLNQNSPAYLEDHRVFGTVVMPAAGYLESAIAAARSSQSQPLVLRHVSFLKALILPEDKTVLVQTVLTRLSTGESEFEIFSQPTPAAATWQCHAKGRLEPGADAPAAFPLEAKREELANELAPDTFYDAYQQQGISYGPEFRILERIWCGSGEALAQIRLSTQQLADIAHYQIHPILLDAGLQLAGATLDQQASSATYLPVGVESFSLCGTHSPLPAWVYASRKASTATGTQQANPVIDIKFLAADGAVLAFIEGLQLQPATSGMLLGEPQPSDAPETTWLYQVMWQPQPLPSQPADFLPSPETIRNLTANDFTQLLSQPEFIEYQALLPQLETLSLHYITQALEELGWSPQSDATPNTQDLAAQLNIAPQHQLLFQRLLATWETGQGCKVQGARCKVLGENIEPLPLNLEPLTLNLQAELPLLTRCGENLAAVLRGEVEPLTLLFPEGDLSDLTQLYERSPGARVMNALVQRAVVAAISQYQDLSKNGPLNPPILGDFEEAPPKIGGTGGPDRSISKQRSIRILEIGAGTGGTTAHLLPHLQNVEYVFTDVSPLFLAKAQERFRDYSFVRYELLDIEQSPASQGFQQPFDLVIAANVLHATADLRQTLTHVRELLAPGGELILLEGTQSLTWLDLIFGLTEGWWKFTDRDLRPHHPLLAADQWQALLAESGFTAEILQPSRRLGETPAADENKFLEATFCPLPPAPTPKMGAGEPDNSKSLAQAWARDLGRGQRLQQNILPTISAPAEPDSKRDSVGFHSVSPNLPQAVIVAQRNELPESLVARGDWLILSESSEVGQQLVDDLQSKGQSPFLVLSGPVGGSPNEFSLDWSGPDLEAQLLQILQMGPAWQGVVYLTAAAAASDSLSEATKEACRRNLRLVQAMLKANLSPVPRLYLVTQGATAPGVTEAGLARSPLWGLAKTVSLEYPELRCTCVDLDGAGVEPLTAELLANLPEQQICLQPQQRRVARLQPYQATELADEQPLQLVISEPGTLVNLTFQPLHRRSPAAHEVEIRVAATGLNFRDVLTTLGQYPGEPALGCECVGVVVTVGGAVQDLTIGQRVMAIASDSFSHYVTVHRAMVIPVPEGLSLEAAATIPVAFLTAHYSLVQLAQLKPGERVLIHAAAGGVGQAAIQIAQAIGADIITTASPGKWEVLRSQGITHILNSRTLDFADAIMASTNGQGVDVVLNSLAGEFRDKSIQVLSPTGRFIELGLGDLPTPAGKPYFPVNLVALCQSQPDLIQSMLQTLHQQFESGVLRPLPHITFPLEEAVQAFRTMQQAKHMGKVVLKVEGSKVQGARYQVSGTGFQVSGARFQVSGARFQVSGTRSQAVPDTRYPIPDTRYPIPDTRYPIPLPPSPHLPISPSSTYLITGGTGGLGLQVADWLIAQGVRHLLLLGRREPTPEVREQIQTWEAQGAAVETAQVDVGDAQALAAVLGRVAESSYPLRGVIHAAGVLSDARLEQLAWAEFERVLAPKVDGAWNLHQLTKDLPLDFFVLFSSAASLLGSPGQANHAAANAFLDGLAHHRRSQGLPALSLNWGAWSDVGSALKYQQGNALTGLQGVGLISPEQGLEKLAQVWTQPIPQIGIAPIQWSAFLRQGNLHQSPFLEAFRQTHSPAVSGAERPMGETQQQVAFRQQLAATSPEQQRALLEAHVCTQISQILGFAPEALDRQTGFFDLGLDSLTAMELKNSLQASLGCSLPSTLAFDYPTVDRLLDYLAEQLLSELSSAEPPPAPEPVSEVSGTEAEARDLPLDADVAAQLDQKLADLEDLLN